MISQRAARDSLFPLTDQLPLGRLVSGGDPVPVRSGGIYGSDGVTTGDPEPFPALFPGAGPAGTPVVGIPVVDAPEQPIRPFTGDESPAGGPGTVRTAARQPSVRPFGLRFATVHRETGSSARLDLERIRYDEVNQIALAWDDTGWMPLVEHSMGLTLRTTGQIPREDEIHDKS